MQKLFGTEALLNTLNEDPSLSPRELDDAVRDRIREFMGDADLFDDLTTLCVRYTKG